MTSQIAQEDATSSGTDELGYMLAQRNGGQDRPFAVFPALAARNRPSIEASHPWYREPCASQQVVQAQTSFTASRCVCGGAMLPLSALRKSNGYERCP